MKPGKLLYYSLMLLPFLIVFAALPFLPEQIPAHYGADNQVTRWGSKYESLIYPVTTLLMGYFLLFMAKLAAKQEKDGKNNEQIIMIAGILILTLFNVMNVYFLYTSFHKVENLSSVPLDLNQLLFGLLGVFMIIIGNIMPKLRMNAMIGLRTKWSMKNELTWKKSQRFGGISFLLGGITIILISFFMRGFLCLLASMGIVTVLLIVDICYTYKVATAA